MDFNLTHFDLKDVNKWHEILSVFEPDNDIYFYPEYFAAYEANGDGRAVCTYVRRGDAHLLVPYLVCTIPSQPDRYDIQGAYGYGGPLAKNVDKEFLEKAWQAIEKSWQEQNVVAAFLRLHPVLNNSLYLDPRWFVEANRETVSVDLRLGVQEAFAGPKAANHRNMVARAVRLGFVATQQLIIKESIKRFVDLYTENMRALNVDKYYYFSEDYFATLVDKVGANFSLYEVNKSDSGETLCMALILWGTRLAHYHLSARAFHSANCAMNLLLQTVAQDATARGLQILHLGGGRTLNPDDSLMRFKQNIGQTKHTFCTARQIIHHEDYNNLVKRWQKEHSDKVPGLFLAYRQI